MPSSSQSTAGDTPAEADWEGPAASLLPYAPRLAGEWLRTSPDERHRAIEATAMFADISGFTALTERLARLGAVGAEQMSDTLDATFGRLLTVASADGADLLKWGGDAVVLLFRGDEHAARAARAAHRMRASLRDLVRRHALPVRVNLRMSIGVHTGVFDLFLVGDPASHRELLLAGPAATVLVEMEKLSQAGQIGLSATTVALLPRSSRGAELVGASTAGARLLSGSPVIRRWRDSESQSLAEDVTPCIPPMIRRHLVQAQGESEHRSVAVAFVEFSGTDVLLGEEGQADAVADALDDVVRNVQQACLDHGVTFFESDLSHDGGKIMLTAGAPTSSGEDSERLLRTARDIVDRAGVLSVRVGVNRGSVFAGDFGPSFRRTYSVKGDAVNLAARIMARAAPGEVLASDEVVSRSYTHVRTERLEPFLVKGKSRPVQAQRVLGLVEGRSAARAVTPFFGRELELLLLRAPVLRTLQRTGSVVDISGEPGIGKSRLVAELAPLPPEIAVLVTACSNYDASASYFAFRTVLRDLLGISATDDGAGVMRRLTRRLQDNAAHLLPWLPLLAPLLGVELPPSRETQDLDERFRRTRLEEVALELLDVTLPTATLLVFEDAHLIDEASASLLQRLLARAHTRPWCVVITRRESEPGATATFVPDPGLPRVIEIPLGPLSDEAATDLIEAAAGDARLGVRDIEAMAGRAAGNPLFLSSLASVALLEGDSGNLPASVEAVYVRELDRLPPRARTLLRYAAVIGMRFDPHLLASLVPDADGAVHTDLGEVADFVETLEDGTVQFRHSLLRDVAYDGLPFRLRRSMHARVAHLLEGGDEGSANPASLSHHFHAAGLHAQTWTHSLVAGEQAAAAYAYSEAAAYFGRALDAAGHLPDVSREARTAAYVRLGEARDMAGQSTAAIAAFRDARHLLPDDPVGRARLLYREARIGLRLGRYPQSLRVLTRALRMLDGSKGPEAEAVRAELATRYGFCRHLQGRTEEAIMWTTMGARWAESSSDTTVLAHAYNALHLAYGASSKEEDQPYGRLALAAYEGLEDLHGQALCTNNLAIDDYRAGRWTQASEMFERAGSMFRRLGDEANEGNVTYNLGDVLVSRGRFEEALPPLRRALRLARGADDEELVALALREGARAHAALGHHEQAWELFADARARFTDLHLRVELALLDAARAEALLGVGRVEEGLRLVARAQDDALAQKLPDVLPRLHRIRAFALLASGRPAEAAQQASRGLEQVTPGGDGYEEALLVLARAEAMDPDDPEAIFLRVQGRAALDRLGVVHLAGVAAQMLPLTSSRNHTTR
ncbi:hypothetical protein ASG74_09930 [Knoellia sp. Soil729]|nr:hypothetical protein ASG74_09930 [Knoellia sp. Soil729]